MKRINYILLLSVCILLFTSNISCKKFLEEKSDKKLIVPTTIKDFQGLLDDFGIMNQATPSLGEDSGDDYFMTDETYKSRIERERNQYIWALYEKPENNDWNFSYRAIFHANLCLEGIEKIKMNEQNAFFWKNVKGSSHFYRAYHFLQLAWIFAKSYDPILSEKDFGIALRLQSNFNIPSTRGNVKETYAQIVKDARIAIDLLPENPQHPLRPSKAAAYGLLARTFLTMNQYDSSYKYANLCLSIKRDLMDYNFLDLNRSLPFDQYNEEVIFHSTMNTTNSLHFWVFANIDTLLYAKFENEDLRKLAFFDKTSQNFQTFRGTYDSQLSAFFTGIATDEMYLIRAESSARLNNLKEALLDLNTLLQNRYKTGTFLPFEYSEQEEVIRLILEERRKELLMRGLRWPDIKRLNKLGSEIQLKRVIAGKEYILPPNDDRYALPLPWELVQNYNYPSN